MMQLMGSFAFPLRSLAVGEECVSHYLGRLASGHIIVGPEVRSVCGWHAWLPNSSAGVPAYRAAGRQPLYPDVEWAGRRHILKTLLGVVLGEACGVGHYLRQ